MNKTKVYFPYVDFEINGKKDIAHRIILESLLANGPAYTLVVHESDEWRRIEEEILMGGMLEIISKEEEQKVIEEADLFFAPCIKGIPFVQNDQGYKFTPDLLTNLLRKSLSQFLIAIRHDAWIYGDNIIEESLDQSKGIIYQKDKIDKVGIERVTLFKNLLQSYQYHKFAHLYSSDNHELFHDFNDILDDSLIKELSELNHNLGCVEYKLDKIENDARKYIQDALDLLKDMNISYVISASSFFASLLSDNPMPAAIGFTLDTIKTICKDCDFRKYAPPLITEKLFKDVFDIVSYSLKPFNEKVTAIVPTR